MELLIIFLYAREHLEKIASLLVEVGVTEATITEGQALGQFLAFEVPIFAGLRQLVGEKRRHATTILAVVEDEKKVDALIRLLRDEGIDFTQPGTGVILSLPIKRSVLSEE